LNKDEIKSIADSIAEITGGLGMKMCASLGKLDEDDLAMLKRAGLTRYHHNIETSPSYFSNIATTHTFNERVEVIKAARKAGLEVCSGGIIGMGERWDDRIEMAFILRELEVTSVPLNVLVPIKGTPFENMKGISASDAIRTIAIFRVILENKIIKLAAGRESILKDFQAMAFMAGANGMLIGGYLTIGGRAAEEDRRLVQEIEGEWRR
jgi:biotin synthase